MKTIGMLSGFEMLAWKPGSRSAHMKKTTAAARIPSATFGAVTTCRHRSIAKTATLKRMKKKLGFASQLKNSFTPVPSRSAPSAPSSSSLARRACSQRPRDPAVLADAPEVDRHQDGRDQRDEDAVEHVEA